MIKLIFLITCALCTTVSGGRVLMLMMQASGHLTEFGAVAEGLTKAGHEVFIVANEHVKMPDTIKKSGGKLVMYKSPDKEMMDNDQFGKLAHEVEIKEGESAMMEKVVKERFNHECYHHVFNEELKLKIKDLKVDIAVVDGLYFCYHVLTHMLDIPTVTLSSAMFPYIVRVHPIVGTFDSCSVQADNTFLNRLKTFLVTTLILENINKMFHHEEQFLGLTPDKPYKSVYELARRNTKLWLINRHFSLDCAIPANPNVVYVGGLGGSKPTPLTKDIDDWMNEAKDGVVVVSFGSLCPEFPREQVYRFNNAFKNIKQRVIWRFVLNKELEDIVFPPNVRIMKWMPQTGLLNHKNTKVFITHGGNNGVNEGITSATPMVAMPLAGDQYVNANKIVVKEFGMRMDIEKFASNELTDAINELVQNPKYTKALDKAAAIFHSFDPPQDRAAYWIGHVMKYGGDHLRTSASDMSLVQFLMLDIFLFLFVTVIVIIALIVFLAKKLFSFKKQKKD